MVSVKEARKQNRIPEKYNTSQNRSQKKTQSLVGRILTSLEHETCRTEPKVYNILEQIRKNIVEMAKIQENIDENIFLQLYEKL